MSRRAKSKPHLPCPNSPSYRSLEKYKTRLQKSTVVSSTSSTPFPTSNSTAVTMMNDLIPTCCIYNSNMSQLRHGSGHRCQIDCTNHDEVITGLELKSKDLYYFWVYPFPSSVTTNGCMHATSNHCSRGLQSPSVHRK